MVTRSGSILAQVMTCCLTARSHYLNQCWHSSKGNFTRDTYPLMTKISLKTIPFHHAVQSIAHPYVSRSSPNSPRPFRAKPEKWYNNLPLVLYYSPVSVVVTYTKQPQPPVSSCNVPCHLPVSSADFLALPTCVCWLVPRTSEPEAAVVLETCTWNTMQRDDILHQKY